MSDDEAARVRALAEILREYDLDAVRVRVGETEYELVARDPAPAGTVVMAAGAALPYLPFGAYFGFVPLPAVFWIWIAGFLLCYAALTHGVKVWFIRKFGLD